MYGLMAKVPVKSLVTETVREVMAGWYAPDAGDIGLSEEDDDGLMGFVNRHRETVDKVLDTVEKVRRRLPGQGD